MGYRIVQRGASSMASMEIEVRLFAMLRERAGTDSLTIELEDGATVRDAITAVEREPALGDVIARMPIVMAVNREYAPEDCTLSEGDEVALIPPVSGGDEAEGGAIRKATTA